MSRKAGGSDGSNGTSESSVCGLTVRRPINENIIERRFLTLTIPQMLGNQIGTDLF